MLSMRREKDFCQHAGQKKSSQRLTLVGQMVEVTHKTTAIMEIIEGIMRPLKDGQIVTFQLRRVIRS